MAGHWFRLYRDDLAAKASSPSLTAPNNRVIYVREGQVCVRARGQCAALVTNGAWHGAVACELEAGTSGASLLRWELSSSDEAPALVSGAGVDSSLTVERQIELKDAHLLRCDRVDFPLGGIAYSHTHQGPGIRCLLKGQLLIRIEGATTTINPGAAWFEAGPRPVYAAASNEALTGFVRVMVLPRALKGKSSIHYVLPEDQDKPKLQKYQLFFDEYVAL